MFTNDHVKAIQNQALKITVAPIFSLHFKTTYDIKKKLNIIDHKNNVSLYLDKVDDTLPQFQYNI